MADITPIDIPIFSKTDNTCSFDNPELTRDDCIVV